MGKIYNMHVPCQAIGDTYQEAVEAIEKLTASMDVAFSVDSFISSLASTSHNNVTDLISPPHADPAA